MFAVLIKLSIELILFVIVDSVSANCLSLMRLTGSSSIGGILVQCSYSGSVYRTSSNARYCNAYLLATTEQPIYTVNKQISVIVRIQENYNCQLVTANLSFCA